MTASDTRISRLQAQLDSVAPVLSETPQIAPYAIAANSPTVVVQPNTVEQVVDVLAFAERERLAVVPWGQGTQMHLGGVPHHYDVALSLAGLNRIVEYDVSNLTVIAEAGVPLRDIYRVSLLERQFLPLGFPGTAASLGGLLVTNTSGVKRTRYGGLRDLLLGVKVALPEGELVRFGGRVVKNVAGYDMSKLFIGSLGAFGVVVETCYRLASVPEDDRILALGFAHLSDGLAAAAAIHASSLQPSGLMLISGSTAAELKLLGKQGHVVLLVNVDGQCEAVDRQLRDSDAICAEYRPQECEELVGDALLAVWEGWEDWQAAPSLSEPPRLQVRLGVLPSHLKAAIEALSQPGLLCPCGTEWWADVAQGQVVVHIPLAGIEPGELSQMVQAWLAELRAQVQGWNGYGMVLYAPAELRVDLDIWGTSGTALLGLYKQQFDPHRILNPGRYLASL